MVVKAELNSFDNELSPYFEAQEGYPFKLACNPPTGSPKPTVTWQIRVSSADKSFIRLECIYIIIYDLYLHL